MRGGDHPLREAAGRELKLAYTSHLRMENAVAWWSMRG